MRNFSQYDRQIRVGHGFGGCQGGVTGEGGRTVGRNGPQVGSVPRGGRRRVRVCQRQCELQGFLKGNKDTVQGGQTGRGTQFVDIKSKVPPQCKLLLLTHKSY